MVLGEFENLLQQAMGLDAASIGSTSIERAVQERLAACKLEGLPEYWELVSASESERQELIEAVVVPETWFFRDREAFTALPHIVQQDWPASRAQSPLRLLSLPSSTGEEAYSIVMALFDAGLTANRFRVDAIDISRRALAQAERAVYGKNSFRGNQLDFRERYFEATAQGYRLNDGVRRQVQFQLGNLFAADFLPGVESYDIVFCRNLLIYFDRVTQDRAIKVLERLLRPQGVLFVAPSETGLLLSHDFISVNMPLAFAFRKPSVHSTRRRTEIGTQAKLAPPIRRAARKPVATPKPMRASLAKASSAPESLPVPAAEEKPKIAMDQAAKLADQGRFVEAAKCCEEDLLKNGPSAHAFHLMGLVRDATGNHAEATDYYRKALYLDPDHHEALIHLAFLIEKEGSLAGAQALRERARRVEQKRKA
jgi:chemotaxis protein methyltransferase WspC